MDSTLELMQSRFPHIYNVYDESTVLYALLSVYANKYNEQNKILDRLHDMIGIDTTHDEDLEHRWGSLLGIYKKNFETYDEYRNRLLMVYLSLAGGTAQSIKHAIASSIGICGDDIDKYIHVYDAWDYFNSDNSTSDVLVTNNTSVTLNNNFNTNTNTKSDICGEYGYIVCTVDISANENVTNMKDEMMSAINATKASGIYPYLVFSCNDGDNGIMSCKDDIIDRLIIMPGKIDECNISSSDDDIYGIIDYEYASIYADRIPKWDTLGTNSLILNESFVTNILQETDKHDDMEVIANV